MAIPEFDELWAKAKLFAARSLSADDMRDFDERAFWATTALEFLAKAALAQISPLLIIPPDAEGTQILAAFGVIAHEGASVQTIQAKTLWIRAERSFRPFSKKEATQFSNSRNEYMHGGGTGTPPHPEEVWWGKFWHQASILVVAADQDLHGLLGNTRLAQVEGYLAKHKAYVEEHVAALLGRAQQRLDQRVNPGTPGALRDQLNRAFSASAEMTHSTMVECPVCGVEGFLEGEETGDIEVESSSDPWDTPAATAEVYAEYFGCPNCHLVLDRLEFLEEAGVATTFNTQIDYEPEDYDYGND